MTKSKNKFTKWIIVLAILFVLVVLFLPNIPFFSMIILGTIMKGAQKGTLVDSLIIKDKNLIVEIYENPLDYDKIYLKYDDNREKFITDISFVNFIVKMQRLDSNNVGIIRVAWDSSFTDTTIIKLE